ncbi:hypothetical protein PoB_004212600 [Plakobranchus ocellatus]|uniref:Uncharacterized protein n=1 Tax=Plakobranchus ocellatus TaxID=259542 RepID=A0AAV4B5C4_9GAST|nr:hypothetical protein PoB_004212600 [Plakobranchus ocellatus]
MTHTTNTPFAGIVEISADEGVYTLTMLAPISKRKTHVQILVSFNKTSLQQGDLRPERQWQDDAAEMDKDGMFASINLTDNFIPANTTSISNISTTFVPDFVHGEEPEISTELVDDVQVVPLSMFVCV